MALQTLPSADAATAWLRASAATALRTDSRQVQPGDAFIAWPGHTVDARQFVRSALERGAAACLVEADGADPFGFDDARVAALPGLKAATGPIAHAWFGRPSARLDVIAGTGTNGKTSTAWWTAQALAALGRRCGVVGTLGVGEPPAALVGTGLTTPDPVRLHAAFAGFVEAGLSACALEASSIGLVEHRLDGTAIDVALFTNFTRDHLDYHGTMDAYWAAKRRLFDWPGLKAAVIHVDDAQGAALAVELAGRALDLWPVSARRDARLQAHDLCYVDGGLAFELTEAGAGSAPVRTRLIGDYNVGNLLVVLGALRALGVPLAAAAGAAATLTPVPGRMQRIGGGRPEVVVDYAHTPDALEQVLHSLRPLAAARGGRLWCVFGCGGNRDASKRPLMGAAAERLADRIVLTSDNPRHEAPAVILAQIAAGLQRPAEAAVVEDRRAAIVHALHGAGPADVVLIAGKGHEDTQEIAGVKRPFSDAAVALQVLQERSAC